MIDIEEMDYDEECQRAGFDPPPLVNICLEYITNNLNVLFVTKRKNMHLRDDAILPAEISDKFVQVYQKVHKISDGFASIFKDRRHIRIRKLKLRNATVSNSGLRIFLKHHLEELDIADCRNLTIGIMDIINHHLSSVKSLRLGTLAPGLKLNFGPPKCKVDVKFVNLRKLILKDTNSIDLRNYMHLLNSLTHLELSGCYLLIDPLCIISKLTSLSLYNVRPLDKFIDWFCKHPNLEHLDISQHDEKLGVYGNPDETLDKLIDKLPNLQSLDISGTNLAGYGIPSSRIACDIPGLSSRVDSPLQFLGLYRTSKTACYRHDIPALRISGNANEEQILTAATLYIDRPEILTSVLNDLYHLFRSESKKYCKALNIVLRAMDAHVEHKHIQICGSATLFYIVKGRKCDAIGVRLRRHIITALINGLEAHVEDPTMMRNGCLTLCQLKIPSDVIFGYERVVKILLRGVSNFPHESFVQRIAIYLLNSLACQVDNSQKSLLGDHGVILIMHTLISERLEHRLCDDVLEVAWSTMWNVTDETPINCQRFLKCNGLELFLNCLEVFPDRDELLRNMMGLLGNVAEVKHLRSIFMTDFLISRFVILLSSNSDGIEVSYNAAGVLAHIASDGEEAWTIPRPTRREVLSKMVKAIESWDIHSRRNINYRSLEPLIGLLKANHTPECQYWAVWAFSNLTTVYPDKYCSLVKTENGIEFLKEIIKHPTPYPTIKKLAKLVLNNCMSDD